MSGGDSSAAERMVECVDAMFQVDPRSGCGETSLPQQLEVASEVLAEDEEATATTTTSSERSVDSSCKRRDLVCEFLFIYLFIFHFGKRNDYHGLEILKQI
jgi:hypothetical protein